MLVMQRELKHISRDALAGVLGVTGERRTRIEGVRMLDIRRHDERALYGSIPGVVEFLSRTYTALTAGSVVTAWHPD